MDLKTVVFYCNWSSYPGLQLSRSALEQEDSNNKLLVSMCSGRVSPELIVNSFKHGAWGVMVAACPADSCEHDGNYRTVGRIALLKNMLEQLGIASERLKLEWIDKGEAGKLQGAIKAFNETVEKLGPVNISGLNS
jgi:F420-non-reducing hydrogenase iron-sulfur subunit